MAEKVGSIYYSVSLDTGEMVRNQRNVDRELGRTTASLDRFQAKVTQVAAAIGMLASATFLIAQSDAYTKLNAQLKLATDGYSSLGVAQEKVRSISREAQADISAIGVLYARITNATKQLHTSQAAVGDITRVVALSMKVSGASAQESSSAMLQLSQAFASGVMRGEEFNSVSEAAPRLMKALADGMGVPIGRLRAMAEAGKLTTSVLVEALPKALASLEEEAKHVQTVSGAFQVLKNEVMLFVGAQTTANGSAAAAANVLKTLAANLDLVAAAAVGIAATKLSATILAISVATVANIKTTLDSVAAQRAQAASTVAAAEAKVVETAATVAAAESELAATGAKIAGMQATQAAIVVARADAVAKLQGAQAAASQAQAQIAAATAAGALSYALALVRSGTLELAAAQAVQAKQTAELAILGRQQASVSAQIAAATAAQTAASRALILANGAQATAQMGVATAVSATSGAMTAARTILGSLGGPIGLITTLLGVGATAWMLWGNSAETAGGQAERALGKAKEDHSRYAKDIVNLDGVIARERAKGSMADETRIARLTRMRASMVAQEKKAWNEIRGMEAEKTGREMLDRNYVTRYEDPAAVEARQREALKRFHEDNMSDLEKYEVEAAQKRAELGALYTPDVDAKLRKKHKLDKKDRTAGDADGARQYYQGLVAENAIALDKIDAQEREALAENDKRAARDLANKATYAAAELEIRKKFARERGALEEKGLQETADLNIAMTTDEVAKIEAVRAEEFRRADAAVKLGVKTFAEGERAKTLAAFNEAQAKADIAERIAQARADTILTQTRSQEQRIVLIRDEAVRQAEVAYQRGAITFEEMEARKTAAAQKAVDDQRALQTNRTNTAVGTLQIRADTTGNVDDQVALIRAQAEAELAANQEAWLLDLEASQLYADRKVAIIADMNQKIADVEAASTNAQLAMAGNAAGQLLGLLQKAGKERTALARAAFLAEKAFAVAQIIVNTEAAAAKAMQQMGIYGIPMATMIRATGYASAGMVAGMAIGDAFGGGRENGGPVGAGQFFQFGEQGKPEMLVSGGKNYLLPGDRGRVVSNADMQGGLSLNVHIYGAPAGSNPSISLQERDLIINLAAEKGAALGQSRVDSSIASNTGSTWRSLVTSSNVKGRM